MRHVNSHHKITEDIGENANINFYKGNFISRVIPEETNETINFNKSNFLSRVIPEEKMKLLLISLKQKWMLMRLMIHLMELKWLTL